MVTALHPQSTNRKALLIHGFGSNSDTWYNKNTPEDLINPPDLTEAIVDSVVTFSYNLNDLFTENPTLSAAEIFQDVLVPAIAETLVPYLLIADIPGKTLI